MAPRSEKANDWITSARKIYSQALNIVFADSFYDVGWLQNPTPTEADVRETLSGNLCRCTGYETIVDGVLAAAGVGK